LENFIISVNCVIPVFMMICTGALIRKVYNVPKQVFDQLSTMCFRVLLPFMLFNNIYSTDLSQAFDLHLVLFLLAATVIWFTIGYILFTFLEPNPRTRGTYIQTFYRSNIGVVGVAMARSMMDPVGVATVTIAVAVTAPLNNILAIIDLETCRGGNISLKDAVHSIVKNNIVRACALGIAFLLLDIPVPSAIQKGLGSLGDAGSALTMVAMGASLRFDGMKKNVKKLAFATTLRLIIAPMILNTIAILMGFRGNALGTVLLATATPLASTAYAMALACDSDYELTAQIQVITSFLCTFTLFLWIFSFKQLGLM